MLIYIEILGVSEDIIKSWKNVHFDWRYKSKYSKGRFSEMRLTG